MITINKEIKQIGRPINSADIIQHRFHPVWFFTNEQIGNFYSKLAGQKAIKRVFSIGGGGDFAFSILATPSLKQLEAVTVCDIRPMANLSIDCKIGLYKNLDYAEILNLFQQPGSSHREQTYRRIRATITPLSKKVFDFIIQNSLTDDFIDCLKKSRLWYRYSFWQIKHKADYLPYLSSVEKYRLLQKNLNKITIRAGDFNANLSLFKDNSFDLIYVSNILDSKKYCPVPNLYLQVILAKLTRGGLLLVITQNKAQKMIGLVEQHGFYLYRHELHRFNPITSLFGHYSYSLLLFRKND